MVRNFIIYFGNLHLSFINPKNYQNTMKRKTQEIIAWIMIAIGFSALVILALHGLGLVGCNC